MGLKLKIVHDDDIGEDNGFSFQENLYLISNHRDYRSLNTELDISHFIDSDGDIIEKSVKESFGEKAIAVKVRAYIHSGIALSLSGEGQFGCRWDSGVFGLLVYNEGEFGEDGPASFIENHGRYLNGEVYGYQIVDEEDEDEVIDSCYGFVGYEHCEEAGNEALKDCEADAKKEKENRLKTCIKNNVPLEKRV